MDDADEIKQHFGIVAAGLRSDIRAVEEALQDLHAEMAAEFKTTHEAIGKTLALIRLS